MADCIFLRGEAFWLAEELSDPSPERSFVSRPGLHARDASSFWWRRTLCTFQHPPASGRLRPFIASRPLQAVPAGPRAIPVHPFLPGQGPVSVPSGPFPGCSPADRLRHPRRTCSASPSAPRWASWPARGGWPGCRSARLYALPREAVVLVTGQTLASRTVTGVIAAMIVATGSHGGGLLAELRGAA